MINIITGGTGLVGSRLIYDLFNNGERILLITRSKKAIEKLKRNLQFYTLDSEKIINAIDIKIGKLCDYDFLYEIITERAKVFHCAAMVSFNEKERDLIFETNIDFTECLINVCIEKKVHKLCFVSSVAAIGNVVEGGYIDETTPWLSANKSSYSLSKYYSEMEVWKGAAEGLNAVIVNPSVILGPGDWNQGSPQIFNTVYKGLSFFTKGSTGYVDVRDVTKAMIGLMNSSVRNQRFILSAANLTYEELFLKIAKALRVKAPKYHAGRWLTLIGWRINHLFSFVTQKPAKLNKNTHTSAHKKTRYSGAKITKTINFEYFHIQETINFVADKYLASND